MSDSNTSRRLGRSVLALLAGALVGIVLSLGSDSLLRDFGIFPTSGQVLSSKLLALAVLYRTIYSVLGSYVTARLAPYRPMWHAIFLGFIGLAANIAGTVATWNAGPAFGPHWYPLALVALALPSAWLGAKLFLLGSKAS